MKLIFFGTPDYVLPILNKLHKYYEIVAVVTQVPKPAGRDKKIVYSAVDTWAYKHKIDKFFDFENLPQADLGICASFGAIIPKSIINHFALGILNVHPSLLPKYRGSSPIQTQIANGETETGVTIIKMDEKMDHGPIVSSFKEEILPGNTFETLKKRLFDKASQFVVDLIPNYSKDKIKLKPQDHKAATYTKILTKQDGYVDLTKDDSQEIERKLRAYTPWPGIWTIVKIGKEEKRLKILEAHIQPKTNNLQLEKVQLEGKKPVSWDQFKKAYSF